VTTEVTFAGQSGATCRYWTDRPLGIPGGFGAVYEAESKDGTPMAVKVVTKYRPLGVQGKSELVAGLDWARRFRVRLELGMQPSPAAITHAP
jgi:hypothetical protein